MSRPTTTARTPRPSANAARMMARPRIWPAASGFRPMALDESPPRSPMPMPGPSTPRAARPAPIISMLICSSYFPGVRLGLIRTVVGGSVRRSDDPVELVDADGGGDRLVIAVALALFVMAFDGGQDEHEGE